MRRRGFLNSLLSFVAFFCGLGGLLLLAGCTPPEKAAYEAIVSSNAFLKSVKTQHPECTTAVPAATQVCALLKQATAAKDTLIDATEEYCAGPTFNNGGACNPPAKGTPAATQALAKLQAALTSYDQTAADLKGALGK